MSDQLDTALSDAVDGALADTIAEHGGMIQGAITSVMYLDGDGLPSWTLVCTPDQRNITSIGLLRYATLQVEKGSRSDRRESL